MKTISINDKVQNVPMIGLGCMRITDMSQSAIRELIDTCMENGVNFFDHADIYGGGKCEELFGQAITPAEREKMIIQTKCAIRPGVCYDASKDYILSQVDKSLKSLNTEYLDILLLHRPDALMEPEEIAAAFDELASSGKVRSFGVSNHNSAQIEMLNRATGGKIKVNQIQYSIAHCPSIDSGINVNIDVNEGCDRTGSIIEYSQMNGIRLQSWSPFQYGMFKGTFIGNELFPELNAALDRMAEKYNTTTNAIAIAWILRHPAGIQAIVGSTNKDRVAAIAKAADIRITREEWYELYLKAGKQLP